MNRTAIAPVEVDTTLRAIFAAVKSAKSRGRRDLIENHAILEKAGCTVQACVDEIVFRHVGYKLESSELQVAEMTSPQENMRWSIPSNPAENLKLVTKVISVPGGGPSTHELPTCFEYRQRDLG